MTFRSSCVPSLLVTLLIVCAVTTKGESVTLSNGAYDNLIITVSPYLSQYNANNVVSSLKEMITEASAVLYYATNNYLYFKSAQILVPDSWASVVNVQNITNYTYIDGDIHIDVNNPIYENQPYTVQSQGCGQPGDYIHLTQDYLINDDYVNIYGPRGKVLVHEWAKYRWGVFDEIGYASDPLYPLFYPVQESVGYKPTYCADQEIQGQKVDISSGGACTLNEFGMPDENCRFIPDATQTARSSLQSFTHLDSVTQFCDSGSTRQHNAEAPTKHNILCSRQSVWEVMRKHSDFTNTNRIKRDVTPEKPLPSQPTISVVRQAQARYCLVLDYSSSMKGNRIQKLVTTAQKWIKESVADGSWVGIVKFSTRYKDSYPLTEIKDKDSRDALARFITPNAFGDTCIGCGIQYALRNILDKALNGIMILISDGEENRTPFISDTIDELLESKVRVITVAVGSAADDKLENLAKMTNGKSYYVKDGDQGVMLDDAFQEALVYQPSQQTLDARVKIYEFTSTNMDTCQNFSVDSSIGRDITFNLISFGNIVTTLTGPNGDKIYTNSSKWSVKITEGEVGEWQWCIKLKSTSANYTVEVTSKPRSHNYPAITANTWMEDHKNYMIIYTKVEQGTRPIIKANVEASIVNVETDMEYKVLLKDNGQGSDITANDGIYSRYFTKLVANARFSVNTKVWSGNATLIAKSSSRTNKRRRRDLTNTPSSWCCGGTIPINEDNFEPVEPFQRYSSGGSFQVSNKSLPTRDYIAPSRVTDLEVTIVNGSLITLQWTAPGDDLDLGIVSGYIIKISNNTEYLLEEYFYTGDAKILIEINHVTTSNNATIVFGGKKVSLDVKLDYTLPLGSLQYIALVSYDLRKNYSPVSSIAYLQTPREVVDDGPLLAGWEITLIILGAVIIGVLAIAALAIYMLRRPKSTFSQVTTENDDIND